MTPSNTHLVLIPSFNPGARLRGTVQEARAQWSPVWVVVDGSTDGSRAILEEMARDDPQLRVIVRSANGGKGTALRDGLREAQRAGFTHALTMDSDGQHPPECIVPFMHAARAAPDAMILGYPVFDASAPTIRVRGRQISNWCTRIETLGGGIRDALFGFRVYPIDPLIAVLDSARFMRGFDFDAEAAVRLSWRGVRALNLPAPVRYFTPEEGGVSHFDYWRDNVALTTMFLRLFPGFVLRLPLLIARRLDIRRLV